MRHNLEVHSAPLAILVAVLATTWTCTLLHGPSTARIALQLGVATLSASSIALLLDVEALLHPISTLSLPASQWNLPAALLTTTCYALCLLSQTYDHNLKGNLQQRAIGILVLSTTMVFLGDDRLVILLGYELQTVALVVFLLTSAPSTGQTKGIGTATCLLLLFALASTLLVLAGANILSATTQNKVTGTWLLLLGGGVKLALFPLHAWLPKVHVESSTVGSILLAGVSLKTGFWVHTAYASNILEILPSDGCLLLLLAGATMSSLALFLQVDLKRWVAVYSISHMNLLYAMVGLAIRSNSQMPLSTLLLGMVGHSIISSGMFLVMGYVVDSTGTRTRYELYSNWTIGYLLQVIWIGLILANSSFPGTVLSRVELTLLGAASQVNVSIAAVAFGIATLSMLSGIELVSRSSRPYSQSNPTITLLSGVLLVSATMATTI